MVGDVRVEQAAVEHLASRGRVRGLVEVNDANAENHSARGQSKEDEEEEAGQRAPKVERWRLRLGHSCIVALRGRSGIPAAGHADRTGGEASCRPKAREWTRTPISPALSHIASQATPPWLSLPFESRETLGPPCNMSP